MMELFVKTVKDLVFSQKTSIIDIRHGSTPEKHLSLLESLKEETLGQVFSFEF